MELNSFLKKYIDNDESLHAEVSSRKGVKDTLISIEDVNILLNKQEHYFVKEGHMKGTFELLRKYNNLLFEEKITTLHEEIRKDFSLLKAIKEIDNPSNRNITEKEQEKELSHEVLVSLMVEGIDKNKKYLSIQSIKSNSLNYTIKRTGSECEFCDFDGFIFKTGDNIKILDRYYLVVGIDLTVGEILLMNRAKIEDSAKKEISAEMLSTLINPTMKNEKFCSDANYKLYISDLKQFSKDFKVSNNTKQGFFYSFDRFKFELEKKIDINGMIFRVESIDLAKNVITLSKIGMK